MRNEGEIEFIAHHSGLNADATLSCVDFENARREARDIDHNSRSDDLAGQRRASRPGDQRGLLLPRKMNELTDVFLGLRKGDSLRHLAIDGGVSRIQLSRRGIEVERTSQLRGEALEVRNLRGCHGFSRAF